MKAAMQEPLFVEFSDQCLKIVEHEEQSSTSNAAFDLWPTFDPFMITYLKGGYFW